MKRKQPPRLTAATTTPPSKRQLQRWWSRWAKLQQERLVEHGSKGGGSSCTSRPKTELHSRCSQQEPCMEGEEQPGELLVHRAEPRRRAELVMAASLTEVLVSHKRKGTVLCSGSRERDEEGLCSYKNGVAEPSNQK